MPATSKNPGQYSDEFVKKKMGKRWKQTVKGALRRLSGQAEKRLSKAANLLVRKTLYVLEGFFERCKEKNGVLYPEIIRKAHPRPSIRLPELKKGRIPEQIMGKRKKW